jgi:hypothetical protein
MARCSAAFMSSPPQRFTWRDVRHFPNADPTAGEFRLICAPSKQVAKLEYAFVPSQTGANVLDIQHTFVPKDFRYALAPCSQLTFLLWLGSPSHYTLPLSHLTVFLKWPWHCRLAVRLCVSLRAEAGCPCAPLMHLRAHLPLQRGRQEPRPCRRRLCSRSSCGRPCCCRSRSPSRRPTCPLACPSYGSPSHGHHYFRWQRARQRQWHAAPPRPPSCSLFAQQLHVAPAPPRACLALAAVASGLQLPKH